MLYKQQKINSPLNIMCVSGAKVPGQIDYNNGE